MPVISKQCLPFFSSPSLLDSLRTSDEFDADWRIPTSQRRAGSYYKRTFLAGVSQERSSKNSLSLPRQEVAPQFHLTFPNKSLDCGRSFKEGLSPLFSMSNLEELPSIVVDTDESGFLKLNKAFQEEKSKAGGLANFRLGASFASLAAALQEEHTRLKGLYSPAQLLSFPCDELFARVSLSSAGHHTLLKQGAFSTLVKLDLLCQYSSQLSEDFEHVPRHSFEKVDDVIQLSNPNKRQKTTGQSGVGGGGGFQYPPWAFFGGSPSTPVARDPDFAGHERLIADKQLETLRQRGDLERGDSTLDQYTPRQLLTLLNAGPFRLADHQHVSPHALAKIRNKDSSTFAITAAGLTAVSKAHKHGGDHILPPVGGRPLPNDGSDKHPDAGAAQGAVPFFSPGSSVVLSGGICCVTDGVHRRCGCPASHPSGHPSHGFVPGIH